MSLILVPTPIDDLGELDSRVKGPLLAACEHGKSRFIVEDIKPGRRRWLKWGLPRDQVENFISYNEHSADELNRELVGLAHTGHTLYLMSDGGLPAFCDPGAPLVDMCHREGIKVSSLPFDNSISLSVALSGFDHDEFLFNGFLPRDKDERLTKWKELAKQTKTVIIMDTPYRLKKVLAEMREFIPGRDVFMGIDLCSENELVLRGKPDLLAKKLAGQKREFVALLSSTRNVKHAKKQACKKPKRP
jgi:16S rRNA (cytidine1402-2'-O)-methyltransferase